MTIVLNFDHSLESLEELLEHAKAQVLPHPDTLLGLVQGLRRVDSGISFPEVLGVSSE